MIDISVTDLVKSFDLEKKILDGISFQVDTGERVGLLGKNGAGKTTLFNILTGDLDYDSGEVLIAPGRRVGLISQIPVYPAGYTVEDVLRTAFHRTTALKEEMDALTRRMAAGGQRHPYSAPLRGAHRPVRGTGGLRHRHSRQQGGQRPVHRRRYAAEAV